MHQKSGRNSTNSVAHKRVHNQKRSQVSVKSRRKSNCLYKKDRAENFRNQNRIAHVHEHDIDEKFPCACMHKYARATTQHTTRTWNLLTTRRPFRRALPRASGLDQDLPAVSAPPSVRGKSDLSVTLLSCLRKSMRTSLGQSWCSSRRRQNAFVKKSRICWLTTRGPVIGIAI